MLQAKLLAASTAIAAMLTKGALLAAQADEVSSPRLLLVSNPSPLGIAIPDARAGVQRHWARHFAYCSLWRQVAVGRPRRLRECLLGLDGPIESDSLHANCSLLERHAECERVEKPDCRRAVLVRKDAVCVCSGTPARAGRTKRPMRRVKDHRRAGTGDQRAMPPASGAPAAAAPRPTAHIAAAAVSAL